MRIGSGSPRPKARPPEPPRSGTRTPTAKLRASAFSCISEADSYAAAGGATKVFALALSTAAAERTLLRRLGMRQLRPLSVCQKSDLTFRARYVSTMRIAMLTARSLAEDRSTEAAKPFEVAAEHAKVALLRPH